MKAGVRRGEPEMDHGINAAVFGLMAGRMQDRRWGTTSLRVSTNMT